LFRNDDNGSSTGEDVERSQRKMDHGAIWNGLSTSLLLMYLQNKSLSDDTDYILKMVVLRLAYTLLLKADLLVYSKA